MKKYLILLLLILGVALKAQIYKPLEISIGTYWHSYSYNCCINAGAPACTAENYSEVLKDTLIAGKTYYKIIQGKISNNGSSNCSYSLFYGYHYIREDTLLKKCMKDYGQVKTHYLWILIKRWGIPAIYFSEMHMDL